MSEKFKLWLAVEKITNADTPEAEYEDLECELPICLGEFDTLGEADEFITSISGISLLEALNMDDDS